MSPKMKAIGIPGYGNIIFDSEFPWVVNVTTILEGTPIRETSGCLAEMISEASKALNRPKEDIESGLLFSSTSEEGMRPPSEVF